MPPNAFCFLFVLGGNTITTINILELKDLIQVLRVYARFIFANVVYNFIFINFTDEYLIRNPVRLIGNIFYTYPSVTIG